MLKNVYVLLFSTILVANVHAAPGFNIEEIINDDISNLQIHTPPNTPEKSTKDLEEEINELKVQKQEKEKECEGLKCEIKKLHGSIVSLKDSKIVKELSAIEHKYFVLKANAYKKNLFDEIYLNKCGETASKLADDAKSMAEEAAQNNALEHAAHWKQHEYQQMEYILQCKSALDTLRIYAAIDNSNLEVAKQQEIQSLFDRKTILRRRHSIRSYRG